MKNLLVAICFLLIIFTNESVAQKSHSKIIYTHDFPPQMTEEVKKSYIIVLKKEEFYTK